MSFMKPFLSSSMDKASLHTAASLCVMCEVAFFFSFVLNTYQRQAQAR